MECKVLNVSPNSSANRLSFPHIADALLHMDYNRPDILDFSQAFTNLLERWRVLWSEHDTDGILSLFDNFQIHTGSEKQLAELLLALWSAC